MSRAGSSYSREARSLSSALTHFPGPELPAVKPSFVPQECSPWQLAHSYPEVPRLSKYQHHSLGLSECHQAHLTCLSHTVLRPGPSQTSFAKGAGQEVCLGEQQKHCWAPLERGRRATRPVPCGSTRASGRKESSPVWHQQLW